jgi:hypothetical protein
MSRNIVKRFRTLNVACWVLLCPAIAAAQFTTVSATIHDPSGLPYSNGTVFPSLVISGTPTFAPPFGFAYSPPTQPSGLDARGNYVQNLGSNNLLLPAGSTWSFHVCSAAGTTQPPPGAGPVCFDVTGITISGVSQDISAQINAAALPLTTPPTTGPGSGTLTSVLCGAGAVICSPNPITTVGSVTVSTPISTANGGTGTINTSMPIGNLLFASTPTSIAPATGLKLDTSVPSFTFTSGVGGVSPQFCLAGFTSGTACLLTNATATTFLSGDLLNLPAGAAGAGNLALQVGSTNSGLYAIPASNEIVIVAGGATVGNFNNTTAGLVLNNTDNVQWCSGGVVTGCNGAGLTEIRGSTPFTMAVTSPDPAPKQFGGIAANSGHGIVLVNTAAITCPAPVKLDTATANQTLVTTTADTGAGVVVGVCADNGSLSAGTGIFIIQDGVVALTLGTGTCAIGNFVIVDTTTNGRVQCTATYTAGTVIGKAMTAQAAVGSTLNVLVTLR